MEFSWDRQRGRWQVEPCWREGTGEGRGAQDSEALSTVVGLLLCAQGSHPVSTEGEGR